ncbi:hypothetical protein POTOM_052325 [Populus tomentosa]|uniref:HAT C-terminal dimerisation domain-containing protein n=1 Tax=Populus tomentosa TaxID=118781 RepID=A0A8X7Y507_POPTO|nr:hypothetical protein POTOM_052325 [Populus tomentosa]
MASPYKSILMECAKAIEGGRLDVADSLLAVIQSLASKEESIVKYFAEALVRRAYRIRPPWPLPSLPLLSHPTKYEPFNLFATITSKHVIADALNSGYKRLHIIDFSVTFFFWQWNYLIGYLIGDLKRQYGGLQSVMITSIAPKLSKHTNDLRQNRKRAEDTDLELRQLIWNSPDDIVNCISKLRRKSEDEIVVVTWNYILHKLLAQDGAMEQVLSKVKDLGADIMVIVEQEANLNSPDLSERLERSFQYYSPFFESLEEDYDRDVYFRRQIGNMVACEGVDRVERIESFAQWQNRLSLAGFCPVPQKADEFKEDFQHYLEEIGDQDYLEAYGIEEKEGHNILLSRHGCPVAVASVWKVTDPPQFSGGYWKNMLTGLYTMQDTVDDLEGMASSSESEDDEENDPCTIADRNLWSTQGSSTNRIAASAKLYDMLEYTCDLHRLELAVTWIFYGHDGNTNSKGKRILCIDDEFGSEMSCCHAAFAIRLTSTHPCKDDYVLEFLLPDVQEQSAIPAPALNGENASPSVDGGLQSTNKRRKISTVWDRFDKHRGENGERHPKDISNKYAKDISNQGPSSSAMADVGRCASSDISFKEWRKGKYERNMVHSQWNELDQYLQLPPENLDKDGNVLAWWQHNARNFPILGKLARDFLAIPVSTVISKSSEVMKMASVHDGVRPEVAEALIYGKDWLDSPN